MTPATRRRTPSLDVEQALLDAAARLLQSEGPDALSVRRIAGEAGVAPMCLYNRFGGKAGVVEALHRRGFDRLRDTLLAIPAGDPVEELAEACVRYRAFALANPTVYAVMFDRAPDFAPTEDCILHAGSAFTALSDGVRRAQAADRLVKGDPIAIAQQVWAACHGAVSLELRDLGFVADREANYRDLVATVLRGLAATR